MYALQLGPILSVLSTLVGVLLRTSITVKRHYDMTTLRKENHVIGAGSEV